jgi:uncharacterized protein YecE (DUF72 family)
LELDYTYYQMPAAGQLRAMAEKAGPALTFAVKANEKLTHRKDFSQWEGDAETYLTALEPLREAGRLEAVLLFAKGLIPKSPPFGGGALGRY